MSGSRDEDEATLLGLVAVHEHDKALLIAENVIERPRDLARTSVHERVQRAAADS